ARLAEEEARAEARVARVKEELAASEDNLDGVRQLRLGIEGEKGSLEARLADLKAQAKAADADVDAVKTELHRRHGGQRALREIAERGEGLARGTRAVMRERPDGVRGLLADALQAPPELEAAVEAVLGERLGSVLVDSHAACAAAVELLKVRAEGRSS